jgi:hypothetical protein
MSAAHHDYAAALLCNYTVVTVNHPSYLQGVCALPTHKDVVPALPSNFLAVGQVRLRLGVVCVSMPFGQCACVMAAACTAVVAAD